MTATWNDVELEKRYGHLERFSDGKTPGLLDKLNAVLEIQPDGTTCMIDNETVHRRRMSLARARNDLSVLLAVVFVNKYRKKLVWIDTPEKVGVSGTGNDRQEIEDLTSAIAQSTATAAQHTSTGESA